MILGSAFGDLLQQSSESLAGRISYLELSAFNLAEVGEKSLHRLWLNGGFPESFLAQDPGVSFSWRRDFIKSYLERDIQASEKYVVYSGKDEFPARNGTLFVSLPSIMARILKA